MRRSVVSWTDAWFLTCPTSRLKWIRRSLCLIVAVYFFSAVLDVSTWYVEGAPASSQNLAQFFRTAELTGEASWMWSPLFVWDAAGAASMGGAGWVYQLYLILGMGLALCAGFAETISKRSPAMLQRLLSSSLPMWIVWLWFVGWANRIVMLGGIVEPILSVSLFAVALSPIGAPPETRQENHWRTTFAIRLLAVQSSIILFVLTGLMLSNSVWWNGLGAYALVAPVEDRLLDVRGTLFENPIVYEGLTAWIVLSLPVGLWLGHQQSTSRYGLILIWIWCALIGLLSANPLFALTVAVAAGSLVLKHHTPAGTFGAKTFGDGGVM